MNNDGVPDMNKESISVKNVAKQYKAGQAVFKDITMTFKPGEAVGLIGPNGSGKTTFLKLVSVNTFPTEGKVFYGDIDIHKHPHDYLKYVGLVHDEESLPQYLSAMELLEWVLRARNKWHDNAEERIFAILDRLELGEARYDQVGTYSTGMRKKTQIAAALITEPSVLILDEPLRGLDQTSKVRSIELFSELIARGALFLMASHDRKDIQTLFSRVLEFPLKVDKSQK